MVLAQLKVQLRPPQESWNPKHIPSCNSHAPHINVVASNCVGWGRNSQHCSSLSQGVRGRGVCFHLIIASPLCPPPLLPLLPGVVSLAQMMGYVNDNVQRVLACPQRRHRLLLWLRRKYIVNSDFSGIMCFEDSLRWHLVCAAHSMKLDIPEVEVYRACDQDTTSQYVLVKRDAHRPQVLFSDIMSRMSARGKTLFAQGSLGSNSALMSACLRESQGCFPIDAMDDDMISGGRRYVNPAAQRARGRAKDPEASAHSRSQVVFTAAGTPCTPWTSRNLGKFRGAAHPAMKPTVAWICERHAHAETEDIGFHECTERFPAKQMLGDPLRSTHFVKTVKASVTGWCAPRDRLLSALVTKKYLWVGPTDHEAEFRSLFKAGTPSLDASVFMVDNAESVQALAQVKGLSLSITVPYKHLLPDSMTSAHKLCLGASRALESECHLGVLLGCWCKRESSYVYDSNVCVD